MFQPSVPAFLDRAPDLYTYRALEVPPSPVAAPAVPADWKSYDGPDDTRCPQWTQFRQSSQFLQVHRQWLDRIRDCERFAMRHCSGQESANMLDALKILRARLMKGYGEDYAASRMSILFGEGKRAMDRVCVRLEQDALPLEFRRRHLREMAYQLHHCLSTGPAYVQAAAALDTPPHGLRSAFYHRFRQRADEALRQAYLEDHSHEAGSYVQGMEPHGVNRMRLEYRLPGGDLSDGMSFGKRMFDPRHHPRHLQALRQALPPCGIAEELAEQYWGELLERLPPDVPGRASDDDLNDALPQIQAAVTAMDTALAPVSLSSLLEMDDNTDTVRWRRGNALVTRDLLMALEGAGLVTPQPRVVRHRGKSDGLDWQLESINDHLLYVMESSPLLRMPVAAPLSLRHLATIEEDAGPASAFTSSSRLASTPLPDAWLNIVLHDTPTHQLGEIPAHWLVRQHHLEAWLRRVDAPTFLRWVRPLRAPKETALPSPTDIVRTLTTLGRTDLLEALMNSGKAPTKAWLQWAGPDVLPLAVAAPSASTFELWRRRVAEALPTASPEKVSRWFTPAPDRTLLSSAIDTRRTDRVASVLAFIEESVAAGVLPTEQLMTHLTCPLPMLMYQGRKDVLPLLGDFLVKAGRQGWLSADELLQFLAGSDPGWGCEAALAGGKDDSLRWYLDLIQRLQTEGALRPPALAALAAMPSPEGEVVSHAGVLNNRSKTLGAFLDHLINAAQEGRIPPRLLQQQLTCDSQYRSGLYTMIAALPDTSCLEVWREAVHKAWHLNLLSCADVQDLVAGSRFSRHSISKLLLQDDAQPPAALWLDTVQWLSDHGTLTAEQVVDLLRADVTRVDLPPRPLFHLMMLNREGVKHTTRYGALLVQARHARMISDTDLEELLRAPNPDLHTPVLIDAVARGERRVIEAYIRMVIRFRETGHLTPEALLRLMDGRSEVGRSALATAARRGDVQTLQLLLDLGLEGLQRGLLSTLQWFSLLAPDAHTEHPMVVIQAQKEAALTDAVQKTLRAAQGLGVLDPELCTLAASLLGVPLDSETPEADEVGVNPAFDAASLPGD